ncbi:MAG TPA: hypothetical protein ENJ55_05570, partial [Rhizobiales bacterium]|nr:hypothetical protein [Hyphomicrobiales bacterium]
DLLASILGRRNELEIVYEDLQAASCRLAKALGIGVNDTFESLVTESKAGWNLTALETAKKVLASQPGSTNQTTSMLLDRLLKTDKASDVFDVLFKITHTAKGTMKTDRSLCSPKCAKEFPDTLQALQELAVSASQLIEKINAVKILKTTESAMYVGKIITQEYDAEKNRLGVYDYQDLISKVLGMFSRMPDAAWVLYKLDGGLDHILIDEAQDTSPAQWDIIQFLADDFFTGAGARPDILRSIFAVGDRKQSIYSFQGAAPESFDLRHRYFRQVVRQCGLKFESVDFEVSFRSTSPVLELVDEVFAQAIAAEGVDKTIHSAQRATAPGLVELWPLEEKASTEKHSAWVPHSNPASESQAQVRLAQKIARKIRLWLDSGERLHSVDRAVRPGDILILVRKRTLFMAALVRALKLAGVPVAGVDRLLLTRHIAVQDMLALAQFVLTPQDDLNFAGLLKSTLLSRNDGSPFDDDDLIFISTNRGDKSLWAAFLDASENSDFYSNARSELEKWRDLAGQVPPFEFFSGVLITDQKRKNILKRLGSEAGEPIDAFLALAM